MRYYVNEGSSAYSPAVSQCDEETHWFHSDALGSTVGLTDASGGQTDTFLYEAFGTSLGRTGATETPYQFVGGYGYFKEASTGLEQVWWRWLNEATGESLATDLSPTSWSDLPEQDGFTSPYPAAGPDRWGRVPWDETVIGQLFRRGTWREGVADFGDRVAWGWQSGYYACYLDCMLNPLPDTCDLSGGSLTVLNDLQKIANRIAIDRRHYLWRIVSLPERYTGIWKDIIPVQAGRYAGAVQLTRLLSAVGLILTVVESVYCTSKCSTRL